MLFKDIWKNKVDNVDDVLAEDINLIAQELINVQENKANKDVVFTKKETEMLVSDLDNEINIKIGQTQESIADLGNDLDATKQEIEQNISQLNNELDENIENTNKNTQKLGGLSFSISESGILTITKGD